MTNGRKWIDNLLIQFCRCVLVNIVISNRSPRLRTWTLSFDGSFRNGHGAGGCFLEESSEHRSLFDTNEVKSRICIGRSYYFGKCHNSLESEFLAFRESLYLLKECQQESYVFGANDVITVVGDSLNVITSIKNLGSKFTAPVITSIYTETYAMYHSITPQPILLHTKRGFNTVADSLASYSLNSRMDFLWEANSNRQLIKRPFNAVLTMEECDLKYPPQQNYRDIIRILSRRGQLHSKLRETRPYKITIESTSSSSTTITKNLLEISVPLPSYLIVKRMSPASLTCSNAHLNPFQAALLSGDVQSLIDFFEFAPEYISFDQVQAATAATTDLITLEPACTLKGFTPLHLAVLSGRISVVRQLIVGILYQIQITKENRLRLENKLGFSPPPVRCNTTSNAQLGCVYLNEQCASSEKWVEQLMSIILTRATLSEGHNTISLTPYELASYLQLVRESIAFTIYIVVNSYAK